MSGGLGSPLPSWWFDPVELICADKLEALGNSDAVKAVRGIWASVRWSKRLAAVALLQPDDEKRDKREAVK